jgi:hypothetical protein
MPRFPVIPAVAWVPCRWKPPRRAELAEIFDVSGRCRGSGGDRALRWMVPGDGTHDQAKLTVANVRRISAEQSRDRTKLGVVGNPQERLEPILKEILPSIGRGSMVGEAARVRVVSPLGRTWVSGDMERCLWWEGRRRLSLVGEGGWVAATRSRDPPAPRWKSAHLGASRLRCGD